jgi:hypothetical protein
VFKNFIAHCSRSYLGKVNSTLRNNAAAVRALQLEMSRIRTRTDSKGCSKFEIYQMLRPWNLIRPNIIDVPLITAEPDLETG